MANAIAMIRRCARYGMAEGYQEYGKDEIPCSTVSLPEEDTGNGQTLDDPPQPVSE